MKRIILILLTILMGGTMAAEKKILVAYYSRADENYGVGTITKGYDDCIAFSVSYSDTPCLYQP